MSEISISTTRRAYAGAVFLLNRTGYICLFVCWQTGAGLCLCMCLCLCLCPCLYVAPVHTCIFLCLCLCLRRTCEPAFNNNLRWAFPRNPTHRTSNSAPSTSLKSIPLSSNIFSTSTEWKKLINKSKRLMNLFVTWLSQPSRPKSCLIWSNSLKTSR